jgi:hypothetical protein
MSVIAPTVGLEPRVPGKSTKSFRTTLKDMGQVVPHFEAVELHTLQALDDTDYVGSIKRIVHITCLFNHFL